jgi:hypothetical protein
LVFGCILAPERISEHGNSSYYWPAGRKSSNAEVICLSLSDRRVTSNISSFSGKQMASWIHRLVLSYISYALPSYSYMPQEGFTDRIRFEPEIILLLMYSWISNLKGQGFLWCSIMLTRESWDITIIWFLPTQWMQECSDMALPGLFMIEKLSYLCMHY